MSSLRLLPPDPPPAPGARSRARPFGPWAWLPAVLLAGAATCLLLWWNATAETRDLRALPDAQRALLYRHTLDNLRDVCDPAASRTLRDFCHRQAELASRFPACDADQDCRELVRRHLTQPSR